ncbi:MAG: hypothetical protein HY855_21090 [Burkholderiales bacterium]|nr:hypothetical protein [Burkholderiales bacterium]
MASSYPSRTVTIDAALASNEALGRLSERLRASQACFEAIGPLLPPPLRAQLRPGPWDDEGWTLLAPNNAVAAKLRQLVPALEARVVAAGWPARPIRVRIMTSS